jgi:hypothetical protein
MPIDSRRRRSPLRLGAASALVAGLLAAAPVAASQEVPAESGPVAGSDPPVQYPFACTAQDHGLDLIVDNQDGEGVEVRDDDGALLGYSRDCAAETRYWYYAADTAGNLHIILGHRRGPLRIEDRLDDVADHDADRRP